MKLPRNLTTWIVIGMVAGVGVGHALHQYAADAAAAKEIAAQFAIVTDIFLRLIKMVIAPLVFTTIVAGVASMGDSKAVGRVGVRAMSWFIGASIVSLGLGLVFVGVLRPGDGLGLPLPDVGAATNLKTSAMNVKDFITQLVPTSIFQALATNSILQILVFAIMFGFALAVFKDDTTDAIVRQVDRIGHVMLKVTEFVMLLAPAAVFAAVAAVITTQGLGVLITYGKFIASFYAGLVALWVVLIAAGALVLGRSVFKLLSLLRAPTMLAFSTASSESAYPKTMERLEAFGVPRKLSGFVLPLGYSFNLDGSMMYTTFAALFIAQAYGIEMSLGAQVTMLLVLMVSSKGIAGVPRASLVVVAAVLPMFGLPEAGLLLIMGIDQFLDMGRTATNVIGNGIATAVVAKWEGAIGSEKAAVPGKVKTEREPMAA